MAFFKFRLPGSKAESRAGSPGPSESIEGLRRRARHRLIGAAVLVLVAVIGFPLVFDTQPRPVAVDVAIQIPDRNKVKPLTVASAATDAASSAVAPGTPALAPVPVRAASSPAAPAASAAGQVPARASLDAKEEILAPGSEKKTEKPSAKSSESAINSAAKPSPPVTPKPETKPEPKPEAKPPAAKPADDGSRAQALLEGKEAAATPPKAAASDTGRFIVQVGAFADATKARETRLKVEKAGLTTYTHVAETADGKRIRVRVGPFTNRAEAEKAAARIRGLELPAAILTL